MCVCVRACCVRMCVRACVCPSVRVVVVSWIGLVLCLWSSCVGMAIQPMNLISSHHHPSQHCHHLGPQEARLVGQDHIQLIESAPQEPPLLTMHSGPAADTQTHNCITAQHTHTLDVVRARAIYGKGMALSVVRARAIYGKGMALSVVRARAIYGKGMALSVVRARAIYGKGMGLSVVSLHEATGNKTLCSLKIFKCHDTHTHTHACQRTKSVFSLGPFSLAGHTAFFLLFIFYFFLLFCYFVYFLQFNV